MAVEKQWEYISRLLPSNPDGLEKALNAFGIEGWELISALFRANNGWLLAILKRPGGIVAK